MKLLAAILLVYAGLGIVAWGMALFEALRWRRHFKLLREESIEMAKKFQANLQTIQRAATDSFSRAEVH